MSAELTARTWEFDSPSGTAAIEQVRYGRLTVIEPRRLRVTRHVKWGLHVVVEGRRVKQDGTFGMYQAAVSWDETDLSDAPEWVRLAVTEVAS